MTVKISLALPIKLGIYYIQLNLNIMIAKYYQWLHGKWPAGKVEKLPIVGEQGSTNVSGVRIVGDLSGVPLLKFAS